MTPRIRHSFASLLIVLASTAVAFGESPYVLETWLYTYLGDGDSAFGTPEAAPRLCSSARFDDVQLANESHGASLSTVSDIFHLQIGGWFASAASDVTIEVSGIYLVDGADAVVDMSAFVEFVDTDAEPIFSIELDTEPGGFPILGHDDAAETGTFRFSSIPDLSWILNIHDDIYLSVYFNLVARGGASGTGFVQITELKISPRVIFLSPWPPGDVSGDGDINYDDIPALVDLLLTGEPQCDAAYVADINQDGNIDGLDIPGLIDLVIQFGNCAD